MALWPPKHPCTTAAEDITCGYLPSGIAGTTCDRDSGGAGEHQRLPRGMAALWQVIVQAQPELQFIHRILIICSKASVPGGHPGIVYFCKEWLFRITDEEPEMSWWILSAKFCNLTPPKSVPPLTLFFCVPTSNTTILFYFHHLRYAFEDPKLTFLTFPKLLLNPTGITLHQFFWWINYGPTESHQANPGLPVSLFSPHKAFPHFLREELFFFFFSANPRWASQGKKNNESTQHTWNLKVKLWSQIWKTTIPLKTIGNGQL